MNKSNRKKMLIKYIHIISHMHDNNGIHEK